MEENDDKRPRAIVLILGFGGATPRILTKYADLYHRLGCSTVAGTASSSLIFARGQDHEMQHLDGVARSAVRTVAGVIRNSEENKDFQRNSGNREVPVALHILSNGGAFVARRIGVLVTEAIGDDATQSGSDNNNEDDSNDLLLFADRLQRGYQLFDSAPCYPTTQSALTVIRHILPNPWIGIPVSYLFALRVVWLPGAISLLTGNPTKGELFWRALLGDCSTLCPRQAFVYTVRDEIADSDKIRGFAAAIREHHQEASSQRLSIADAARSHHPATRWVRTMHLEDSQHVQHLRLHPDKYSDFVEDILKDIEESEEKQQNGGAS